jgi:hypothetical protein
MAEALLFEFQRESTLVWKQFCTLSIHMLIHLPGECMRHGPLDSFSCWKYENTLASIKRSVHGATCQPLVTAVNRLKVAPYYISHGYIYKPESVPGLKKPNSVGQFETIELANFVLKQNDTDCFFGVKAGCRLQCRDLVYKFHVAEREASGEVVVLGYCHVQSQNFYNVVFPDRRIGHEDELLTVDSSDIGIHSIGSCAHSFGLIRFRHEDIKYKYIVHKSGAYTVAYRMI